MEKTIKGKTHIVDVDGTIRERPDFPKALVRVNYTVPGSTGESIIVDPVFTDEVSRNLYGRIMTLVEATTEPSKLKAVKDVFSKEIKSWRDEVYDVARDIGEHAARQIDADEDCK